MSGDSVIYAEMEDIVHEYDSKSKIDGKKVIFKASTAILRIYRIKFQRDIYKDLAALVQR